ncbi:MAG TPA: RNA polymerase sigma-54 factor, partial [Firmicutes bacterium]|nr:RNA polymerase sigma-54 factor [Bacillota bacterium]
MQISQNLRLQQTQKLIMTPELRQAITVLQLSVPELEDFVEEQLLENPVLDIKEEIAGEEAAGEPVKHEFDWQEYFRDGTDWGENLPVHQRDEKLNFENMVMQLPTLHEHLSFQMHLSVFGEEERRI